MNKRKLLLTLILVWVMRILLHAIADFSPITDYFVLFGSAIVLVFLSWRRKRHVNQLNQSRDGSRETSAMQVERITPVQCAAKESEVSCVRERKHVHSKFDEKVFGESQVTTSNSAHVLDKSLIDIVAEPDDISIKTCEKSPQNELSQSISQSIGIDKPIRSYQIQFSETNQSLSITRGHTELTGDTQLVNSVSECSFDNSFIAIVEEPNDIFKTCDTSSEKDLSHSCSITSCVDEQIGSKPIQSTEINQCMTTTPNSDNVFGESPEPDSILDESLVYSPVEADCAFIKSSGTTPDGNLITSKESHFSTLSQSVLEKLDANLHEDLSEKPHATTKMLEEITLTDLHRSFHAEDELSTAFVDGQISYELSPSKKNLYTALKSSNEVVVKRQLSNSDSGYVCDKSLVDIEAEPDYVFNKTCDTTGENLSRSVSPTYTDEPDESEKDQSTKPNQHSGLTHHNNQVFGFTQVSKSTLGSIHDKQKAFQAEPNYVFPKTCNTTPEKIHPVSFPTCADESEYEQDEKTKCISLGPQNLKPVLETIDLCFNTIKIIDQMIHRQSKISTTVMNNSNKPMSDYTSTFDANTVDSLISEINFNSAIIKSIDSTEMDNRISKTRSEMTTSVLNMPTKSSSNDMPGTPHISVTTVENNIEAPVFDEMNFDTPFTKDVDQVPPRIAEIKTFASDVPSESSSKNMSDSACTTTLGERPVDMPVLELVNFHTLSKKMGHQPPQLFSEIATTAVNMLNNTDSEAATCQLYVHAAVTENGIDEPEFEKKNLDTIPATETVDQVALRLSEISTSTQKMPNQSLPKELTTPHVTARAIKNNDELSIHDVIDMDISPPDKMFNNLPQIMTTVYLENESMSKNMTGTFHISTEVGKHTSEESMINQMFIFDESFIKTSDQALHQLSESSGITVNSQIEASSIDVTEKLHLPTVETESIENPELGMSDFETIRSTRIVNQAEWPSIAWDRSKESLSQDALSNTSIAKSKVEASALEMVNLRTTSAESADDAPARLSKIASVVLNNLKESIPDNVADILHASSFTETITMPYAARSSGDSDTFPMKSVPEIQKNVTIETTLKNEDSTFILPTNVNHMSNASTVSNSWDTNRIIESEYIPPSIANNSIVSDEQVATGLVTTVSEGENQMDLPLESLSLKIAYWNRKSQSEIIDLSRSPTINSNGRSYFPKATTSEKDVLHAKLVTDQIVSTQELSILGQSPIKNLEPEIIPVEFIYPCLPIAATTSKNTS